MKSNIHRNVMRRVYYSYLVGMALEPMLWQGLVLGACVALFGRLTHVASIAHNFLGIPVGHVPEYVESAFVNAFTHGEVLTVLVVAFMVGLTVSFVYRASLVVLTGGRLRSA